MARYYSVFDTPDKYYHPDDLYSQGNGPAILTALEQFLEERKFRISELYLSFAAFNNQQFHNYLKSLAALGIKIKLVTTPIKGLSSKQFILPKDLMTGQLVADTATTPYAQARPILAQHYKAQVDNFQLHIFPHLNIRHQEGNPFKVLQDHFSLKLNMLVAVYKNGGGFTGLSSADLSVGKKVKNAYLVLVEEDWSLLKATRRFFDALIKNSIPVNHFDFQKNYTELLLELQEISQGQQAFFTAPFIKEGPAFAEKTLTEIIRQAQQHILMAGPNIDAYEYEVDGRFHTEFDNKLEEHFGILRPLVEKAAAGIPCKCLCQSIPDQANAFLEMLRQVPAISLATSSDIHFSFMIVDDLLVLSSGDWGADDFIYLDDVQIERFEEAAEENYIGVFSALSAYICISDPKIVEKFRHFFESRWSRAVV